MKCSPTSRTSSMTEDRRSSMTQQRHHPPRDLCKLRMLPLSIMQSPIRKELEMILIKSNTLQVQEKVLLSSLKKEKSIMENTLPKRLRNWWTESSMERWKKSRWLRSVRVLSKEKKINIPVRILAQHVKRLELGTYPKLDYNRSLSRLLKCSVEALVLN